jgi:D-alanine-D-alanine ligase
MGREFSCIILQEAGGEPIALPPTEMLKGGLHFDYRAKYLPGLVRKETPMQVSEITLNAIRQACVALYQFLGCQVYARIDGLLSTDNQLYLNDPNTTAGMTPSSFLFHQAAEIGLNPSQLLTFIIRNSLAERILSHKVQPHTTDLLHTLDQYLVKEVPSLSKLFDLEEGKIIKSA